MPFDRQLLRALGERYDSFYLYDESVLLRRAEALRRAFPSFSFLYSVKANSHPLVRKAMAEVGFGVDAASPREALMGAELGLDRSMIHFSAPGKTVKGLEHTLDCATIVADSPGEVERLQTLARSRNTVVRIGVRIHPVEVPLSGVRQPSKFGVDEEAFFQLLPRWRTLPNVRITGIHVHLKSQILDSEALEDYYRIVFSLAQRVSDALGGSLDFLNAGSGLGIPYGPEEKPLPLASVGRTAEALCARFRQRFPATTVFLETGRYVAGPAGVYVTRVLDKKVSCGRTFVLLSNTLNGFLRSSIPPLAENAPAPCEPLYTGQNAVLPLPLTPRRERETVTLTGNLCTAADTVARALSLPRLEPGDLLLFPNAGSYAAVLSPMQFSSQTPPAELFLTRTGEVLS